jgi:hypothetical protein
MAAKRFALSDSMASAPPERADTEVWAFHQYSINADEERGCMVISTNNGKRSRVLNQCRQRQVR